MTMNGDTSLKTIGLTAALTLALFQSINAQTQYPEARRDPSVLDDYHGTQVADPYRWLENSGSAEVQEFIDKQNNLTTGYLAASPHRESIRQRLTDLSNYTKYDVPQKHGERYFFYATSGLQNQKILYVQDNLSDDPRVFIDPNEFSENYTMFLSDPQAFSVDGEIFAYSLGDSGSEWVTIRFRNVTSGRDYPEVLTKVKSTNVAWTYDNLGVFYGAFPDWNGNPNEDMNENMKIFYHRIGTNQSEDILVVEFPDNPQWKIGRFIVSNHGKSILYGPEDGMENLMYIYYTQIPLNITDKFEMAAIAGNSDKDRFTYIGNDASFYYILTNKNASKNRIVIIDALNPEETNWAELVPEDLENVLSWAVPVDADKMVLSYIGDVKTKLEVRDIFTGQLLKEIALDVGSVEQPPVKRADTNFFFQFESFLIPNRIYLLNFTNLDYTLEIYQDVQLPGYNPLDFTVEQVFYTSKDRTTLVPMFIVHNKNLTMNGQSPVILYGDGGFSKSLLPDFLATRILFLQNFDGIYASANIRGGGEYGEAWHEGGRLENKQNSFDDFQSAAEFLISNQYTSSNKLTIQGKGNGGLLVAVCINQRPDLYAAAIPQIGVFDILRYQKVANASKWTAELGSSDDPEQFEYLYNYSPLHNIAFVNESVQYPAVLVIAADTKDVGVPQHSLKFTAELQFQVGKNVIQTNPLMLKMEKDAGNVRGKSSTLELIEDEVDIYSFLIQSIGLTFHQ